jgi:hypothetical protein
MSDYQYYISTNQHKILTINYIASTSINVM